METKKIKFGFTIVELLTVMSIIALLIGILVPALNMVRRIAKDTRQRAQFHSIDVAMEAYAGEMEQYPDSTLKLTGGVYTQGAHHLAEALIGRDFLGLDPWTTWDAELDKGDPCRYSSTTAPKNTPAADIQTCLDRRKGPYLKTESVEAFQINQLYANITSVYGGTVYPGNLDNAGTIDPTYSPAPVLTDSYRVKTVSVNNKQVKAGSPILYYKANATSKLFYNSNPTLSPDGGNGVDDTEAAASIFNSMDNERLLSLGTIMVQSTLHNFDRDNGGAGAGRMKFYDAITNPKITTQVRPYNQTSYLLMSAGFDGIFGTPDDIYNYSE
ncbi:MAG: type II secretion system protein [Sedimentisphaerales bacterium]